MRPFDFHRPTNGQPGHVHSLATRGINADITSSAARDVRVLHIAQKIAGGIASFFEEIVDYQNAVFGSTNVRFLIPAGEEAQLPSIDPMQIITFSATQRRPGALLQFGKTALAAVREFRPDVLHLHSSFAGALVRALIKPGPNTPKIIYCPHGWAFGIETSSVRKKAYAAVERILARRTDVILVNSQAEHRLALRFGLPAEKISVVCNGIAWAPSTRRKRQSRTVNIAFVGRHDRQKGLDILLDTIERFPLQGLHFHIVGGSVVDDSVPALRRGRANVTVQGWLDRASLTAFLLNMDAVVMPSRWEAFGLVAIEAMRAGVPVIGSNRGALPEIIREGTGGRIFDLDDPDDLGRVLEGIDHLQLKRLGASARALFENEYVAERMNHLTHEAYLRVLGGDGLEGTVVPSATTEHIARSSAA